MPIQSFTNKVAAITGAGSGMGRALAVALASRGCHVALADVKEEALEETAGLIPQGVRVTTQPLDVANREAVESWAAQVVADHGGVNMVFNNAGVSVSGMIEQLNYPDFEWLMNINFWGVVYGSKAFLPYLKQADEAQIVNTASIFGVMAFPTQSAYNASKFAVRGFSYSIRQELYDTSVGVSCVQPGGVKTNIVRDSRYTPSDNAAPTLEEVVGRFEEMAGLTPDQAAEQILRGVLRNKAQILVGRDARLMALVERIIPTGYMTLVRKLVERRMSADGDNAG